MRVLRVIVLTGLVVTLGVRSAGAQSADAGCGQAVTQRPQTDKPVAFDSFLTPLVEQARARRAANDAADGAYAHRVDGALNANRLNIAVLGYGEEHGQTYAGEGVSVTILSLDLATWEIASISLSRDIRLPELEDQTLGPGRPPAVLRDAYHELGFDGIRAVLEDMTGLAIDYGVLVKDVAVRNYLTDINGPVQVTVPKDFYTNSYRLGGSVHPEDFLAAGQQTLDPDHAMTFILAESLEPDGAADERSYRKNILVQALVCQFKQRFAARDAGFLLGASRFLVQELSNQDVRMDFDLSVIPNGLVRLAQTLLVSGGDLDTSVPSIASGRQLVVHDKYYGDGGVRRVHNIASAPDEEGPDNPIVKDEIAQGILPLNMLIPVGGNPYAQDLVTGYWASVRALVRSRLA